MGYASSGLEGHYDMGYYNDQLDGFWSAIGGGLKKAGGFVAKQVVPRAIGAVPVVGGAASEAYRGLIRRPTPTLARPPLLRAPRTRIAPVAATTRRRVPWWRRAGEAALARAREDPELRERIIAGTARYAPPELLAAAGARQVREAPTALKAGTILPALAIAALLLRR